MANRKKEDEGRRVHIQLPTETFEETQQLATRRKLSVSEFIRRAVDFQVWLEGVMPNVDGFAADELAKIKLAQKKLSELELLQQQIDDEEEKEKSFKGDGDGPTNRELDWQSKNGHAVQVTSA